jgi:hypothetical protein
VLQAYTAARDRISVQVLVATLKKLEYVYPYHQVIGYLLAIPGADGSTWGGQSCFYLSKLLNINSLLAYELFCSSGDLFCMAVGIYTYCS